MRQNVVEIYVDDKGPGFNLVFKWIETDGTYVRATPAQKAAVKRFYCLPVENMYADEATQLLDIRDYAQAATSVLFVSKSQDEIAFIEKCIAAFIGDDRECLSNVRKWADRRFANSADSQTVTAGIKRSKAFPSVKQFFQDLMADIDNISPGFLPPQRV